MHSRRITVLLSVVQFAQLIFIGFGGSLVTELIRERPNEVVIFWSSMFSLMLVIVIAYLYGQAFTLARTTESDE